MSTTPSPPVYKSVHFIDSNEGAAKPFIRGLKRALADKPFLVQAHGSIPAFLNAVAPDDMPDAIVCNNRHAGMSGLEWAVKLRREGYRGKFFLYTGGLAPIRLPEGVDGVFEKAHQEQQLYDALRALFE